MSVTLKTEAAEQLLFNLRRIAELARMIDSQWDQGWDPVDPDMEEAIDEIVRRACQSIQPLKEKIE